jgi:hypothetical protein
MIEEYNDITGFNLLWDHIQEDRAMLISELTQWARCNSREFLGVMAA